MPVVVVVLGPLLDTPVVLDAMPRRATAGTTPIMLAAVAVPPHRKEAQVVFRTLVNMVDCSNYYQASVLLQQA
jgi:hypothetical protein